MKKIIKDIVGFFILFVSLYYAFYFISFRIYVNEEPLIRKLQDELMMSNGVMGRAMDGFDANKKYDVLFIGSSHCYRCFNPKVFDEHGIVSYNFGSSSQTPLNSYCLLKKYISNTKKIILEVYPVCVNELGKEAFFTFVNSTDDYSLLVDMACKVNDLRCYNLLSIQPFIRNYLRTQPSDKMNMDRGYVQTNDSVRSEISYEKYTMNKEIYEQQLKYIRKIIQLCDEYKKPFSMVYAPVPKELMMEKENEIIAELEKISDEKNVPFYDYGRNHNLNSKNHFFDDDHLNDAGVRLFNERLINEMEVENN